MIGSVMTAKTHPSSAKQKRIGRRLALALAMQREGLALMRANIERAHPGASARELDRLFERWLLDRKPDAPGDPMPWPRRRAPRAA
jgi:hypothetical protein